MKVSRRTFIASSSAAAAGGALVIGFRLHGRWSDAAHTAPKDNAFDAWIHVRPDGKTILVLDKCEMGQGIYTGLPMILADEAELDWRTVVVQQSLESTGTGGSGSTSGGYLPLRRAGAIVREAMIGAAAREWHVPRKSCVARQSRVLHGDSGRSLSYAALVATARSLPLPDADHVPLKRFAATLTNAMLRTAVRRAVIVSTAFLFKDSIIPPTYLFGRLFFPSVVADASAMEQIVMASELDWTLVRPPQLTDKPQTGRYRVREEHLPVFGFKIAR